MITNVSKEARNRVWWSLITVENKIGLMTGRPTCISVNMCSSPLPLPFEENDFQQALAISLLNDPGFRETKLDNVMASSYLRKAPFGKPNNRPHISNDNQWLHNLPVSAGLYFLYSCDLTMLMQGLLDRVYTANAVHQPWNDIRDRIDEIRERVDVWLSSLPPGLDFTRMDGGDQNPNERKLLALQYYSARIMLGRPCLCQHEKGNPRRFHEDQHFTQAMAVSTIKSAIQMAHLIPDESDAGRPAEHLPWWCLLNYVMQTLTVMILELSFSSIHLPEEEDRLLRLSKKCIRWLDRTSRHSVASHRAWQLCDSAFRRLAEPLGLDISDLPSHPYLQRHVDINSLRSLSMDGHPTTANDSSKQDTAMQDPVDWCLNSLPTDSADPTANSGTNPLSSKSGSGLSQRHFAHDLLSESFLELFFPELENMESRTKEP